MRKYILIGAGGILGAILRYWIKGINIYPYHGNLPLNTFIINITGSFILALILTIAYEVYQFDSSLRLGIATGFLGAFTTFSTLCKETVNLFSQGDYFSAFVYVLTSTIIGLAAVYLGIVLARQSAVWLFKKDRNVNDNPEAEGETD